MLRECKIFITSGREPTFSSPSFYHLARNNGGKTKRGGGGTEEKKGKSTLVRL